MSTPNNLLALKQKDHTHPMSVRLNDLVRTNTGVGVVFANVNVVFSAICANSHQFNFQLWPNVPHPPALFGMT